MDSRKERWLAAQLASDAPARLIEAGAGAEARIQLVDVFVDLPAERNGKAIALLRHLCQGPAERRARVLLVGGPGSGKSTVTTMVAQVLRASLLQGAALDAQTARLRQGVLGLSDGLKLNVAPGVCPVRISLPDLAGAVEQGVWGAVARQLDRFAPVDAPTTAAQAEALARGGTSVLWIFDGLDEVPGSAGRDRVVAAVRAALGPDDHLLVATRPQGYRGEFDELEVVELTRLSPSVARAFGARLLNAWGRTDTAPLELGFDQRGVRGLLETPLHVAMAALLIAEAGALPTSRYLLYQHYFDTLFRRELPRLASAGIRREQRTLVFAIHARVGLTLQVLAQRGAGAAATLSKGALRAIVLGVLSEQKHTDEDARSRAEVLLGFATERLVLLLQPTEGAFTFGIRSLQEFFAAEALLATTAVGLIRRRLRALVHAPLWENVLAIAASGLADRTERLEEAADATAGLCRDIDGGELGREAALLRTGARVALALVSEVQEYGPPGLVNPLWDVVFDALDAPIYRMERDGELHWFFPWGRLHWFAFGATARWAPPPVQGRLDDTIRSLQGGSVADRTRARLLAKGAESYVMSAADAATIPTEEAVAWLDLGLPRYGLYSEPSDDVADGRPIYWELGFGSSLLKSLWHEPIPLAVGSELAEALGEFSRDPSPDKLASVVRLLCQHEVRSDLLGQLPWPIQACVEWTPPSSFVELADRIASGELGERAQWEAAEERWSQRPQQVSAEELQAWLADPRPFDPEGLALGSLMFDDGPPAEGDPFPDLVGESVFKISRFIDTISWRRGPIHVLPAAIRAFPPGVDPAIFRLGVVRPELEGPEAEAWFDLLDEWGRSSHDLVAIRDPASWNDVAALLAERIAVQPGRLGLERVLLELTYAGCDLPPLPDLPAEDRPPWSCSVRAALMLLAGAVGDADVSAMVQLLDSSVDRRGVASVLCRCRKGLPTLLALHDATPPDELATLDVIFRGIHRILEERAVPFSTPAAWTDHALPGPFPSERAEPPRIQQIEVLSGVRLFHETPAIDAPFPIPSARNEGQWIVLIGENGCGKTTLLRAIALALAPPSVGSKLLDERLPMVRNGGEARVVLQLDTGRYGVTIAREDRTESVRIDGAEPEVRPWVVGYGVRRGNARGDKDREVLGGPVGELHTLFDLPASLTNAVEWLKELDRQVLREKQRAAKEGPHAGPREATWNAVARALRQLLNIEAVEPDEDHVYVTHPTFGRVRLDALSDGYLSTAGWVIDLVSRWVERTRDLEQPIGPDLLSEMTGFVLIDEIDLHLHPVWQLNVVENLRRLFPRLSFVATTHNPLTLQGARPGETYVMRRDGDQIELTQRDVLPGYDVDRVLFEQFGVEHTLDRETRELLREHREILERGAPESDPDRIAVERRLETRLGSTGPLVSADRARKNRHRIGDDELHLLEPFLKPVGG